MARQCLFEGIETDFVISGTIVYVHEQIKALSFFEKCYIDFYPELRFNCVHIYDQVDADITHLKFEARNKNMI